MFTSAGLFPGPLAPPPPPITSLAEQQRLDTSNKGHKLLRKMGWSGQAGLGKQEQGIVNPVEGGEVREKTEMYKGVGMQQRNDPFEQFRKNKSQGYIQRLRTRDEQRECIYLRVDLF